MRTPTLLLGVDTGQKTYPSALCVVQLEHREGENRKSAEHYYVRLLERFPRGTPYPQLADRLGDIVTKLRATGGRGPEMLINVTGLGATVADLFEDRCKCATVEVYFTYGDRRTEGRENQRKQLTLGKAFLVTHLKTLLQTGCLHLPKSPEAKELCQQLEDYEITVDQDANERYGAFRVGTHDDFVTALGLAVQGDGGPTGCIIWPGGNPPSGLRSPKPFVEPPLNL